MIWKDVYPKKIKILLWELSHGAINTAVIGYKDSRLILPSHHVVPTQSILLISVHIALILFGTGKLCLMLFPGPWHHQTPAISYLIRFPGTSFQGSTKDFMAYF